MRALCPRTFYVVMLPDRKAGDILDDDVIFYIHVVDYTRLLDSGSVKEML